MMRKRIKIIGLAIALLVVAIAGFTFLRMKFASTGEATIAVPTGWYLHHTKTGGVMLTRQQDLPNIGASEGLAYGEQITLGVVTMDKPTEEWIASRIPDNDPLYTLKERGTLSGHPTLRVEHEAEASGKVLAYYLFSGDRAYIFSLYPLESYDAASKSTVRNTVDVQALEQIVKDYAAKL